MSPLISHGAISGINTTVPSTASGMTAAEKAMSARAILTRMGRNGAMGATEDEQSDGVGFRHRKDLRQQIRETRTDQPTPHEGQHQNPGAAQGLDRFAQVEFEAHGPQVRHRVENDHDPKHVLKGDGPPFR